MTFHAKTCFISFPFSNGIPFRSCLKTIRWNENDLDHPFKKNEKLIEPFEQLAFVKNIWPLERHAHTFAGAFICSNDLSKQLNGFDYRHTSGCLYLFMSPAEKKPSAS